jgi:molybdopterin-guanine dinucleotide biosynthesis protein A
VLAGGAASRFGGRPKGLELVGGERVLDRVVDTVRAATGSLPQLMANDPEAAAWRPDLVVVPDVVRHCGSLGGLYTAVTAKEDPVLVVAWDMPFVSTELLQALMEGSGESDVFLPESEGPLGVEPMCGVYGPACGEPMRRSIDDEDYRTTAFHQHVRAGALPLERVRELGDPATLFFNANEPDDLKLAEQLWRGLHQSNA